MICPKCKAQMTTNKKYCTQCGQQLFSAVATHNKDLKKNLNLIFIFSTVFFLMFLVYILDGTEKFSTKDTNTGTEKQHTTENNNKEKKAIKAYNNLKYDKEKLHKLYKEAISSWDIHKDDKTEDGIYLYGGSSSGEIYITSYITENAPEFKDVIDTIWNYCDTLYGTKGMVEVRNCLMNEINYSEK